MPEFISHGSLVRHICLFRPRITKSIKNSPYSDGVGTQPGCQNTRLSPWFWAPGRVWSVGVFSTYGSWQEEDCICLYIYIFCRTIFHDTCGQNIKQNKTPQCCFFLSPAPPLEVHISRPVMIANWNILSLRFVLTVLSILFFSFYGIPTTLSPPPPPHLWNWH